MSATNLYAQNLPSIKSTLSKNKILIGEPVELVIETKAQQALFPKLDSIPHFEFLEKKIDTLQGENPVTVRGVFKITSFDSGAWKIPSYRLTASVQTDTIPLEVVFSEFDPKQEYHSIKEIIETEEEKAKSDWWMYAIGGLILVALLVYLLRRKKPVKKVVSVSPTLNPFDEAMQRLEQARKNAPHSKEYYSSLTDIFRMYIFKARGIKSLQKTTDDLVVQLSRMNIIANGMTELSQALRLSDFVKFAKYQATEEDDQHSYEVIKRSIIEIHRSAGSESLKEV